MICILLKRKKTIMRKCKRCGAVIELDNCCYPNDYCEWCQEQVEYELQQKYPFKNGR
jgi:uncharacterized OB-fold protein